MPWYLQCSGTRSSGYRAGVKSQQTLNMQVITEQFALLRAHQAIDTDARLAESRHPERVTRVVQSRIDIARRVG
jgi:hypothetical protein